MDGPEACTCPLCRDDPPQEIVERIMASAAQQGTSMSKKDFLLWLDRVGREG